MYCARKISQLGWRPIKIFGGGTNRASGDSWGKRHLKRHLIAPLNLALKNTVEAGQAQKAHHSIFNVATPHHSSARAAHLCAARSPALPPAAMRGLLSSSSALLRRAAGAAAQLSRADCSSASASAPSLLPRSPFQVWPASVWRSLDCGLVACRHVLGICDFFFQWTIFGRTDKTSLLVAVVKLPVLG